MSDLHFGIYPLRYEEVTDRLFLSHHIYPNMRRNYYWSDDFSAEYYIAQAKAGFIAVTDTFEGRELLLPEIQFSYAVLHFEDLHISRKVRTLLKKENPQLYMSEDIRQVAAKIQAYHQNCWLTSKYLQTLLETQKIDENFHLLSFYLEKNGEMIAGEIGYAIGNIYTSLSGFSRKEKRFANFGTAQLVMLSHFLQEHGFAFWNMGQPYMKYKFQLGAKCYERGNFLKLWYEHC